MPRPEQKENSTAKPCAGPLRVLIVDDSKFQRKILAVNLKTWGYEVLEAASGQEGLDICKQTTVNLVLSDWMMPGMDGLEFCRQFRALAKDCYGYFILLTSKDGKEEIATGLGVGADDFLTKPVSSAELRARLHAGERLLRMQRELVEKNRSLSETLSELQSLYQAIDRDLLEARKLQQSLVPKHFIDVGAAQISLLLQPSGHIGGDMVGVYHIGDDKLGLYAFDVSGHGIGSALMTTRVAGWLGATHPSFSIAMVKMDGGGYGPRPPQEIAALMNERILQEMDTDLYLTLLLVEIDLANGHAELVQAGHPNPILQHSNGHLSPIGTGGHPVGLLDSAEFESYCIRLSVGDRLLIYSDGFTEAENVAGDMLEEEGLERMLSLGQHSSGPELLASLAQETQTYSGGETADDLSAILVEFRASDR